MSEQLAQLKQKGGGQLEMLNWRSSNNPTSFNGEAYIQVERVGNNPSFTINGVQQTPIAGPYDMSGVKANVYHVNLNSTDLLNFLGYALCYKLK